MEVKMNVDFNNPENLDNFNASVFANYFVEETQTLFAGEKLTQKENKVLKEIRYLAQKIGEIEVEEPELLKSIFKVI